jgi:hypothetical protein
LRSVRASSLVADRTFPSQRPSSRGVARAPRAAPGRQGARRLLGVSRRQARARRSAAARASTASWPRSLGLRAARRAVACAALRLSARSCRAHFFRVFEWDGDPIGHDGQAFAWQAPGAFDVAPLLPATRSLSRALLLPAVCGIDDGRRAW